MVAFAAIQGGDKGGSPWGKVGGEEHGVTEWERCVINEGVSVVGKEAGVGYYVLVQIFGFNWHSGGQVCWWEDDMSPVGTGERVFIGRGEVQLRIAKERGGILGILS